MTLLTPGEAAQHLGMCVKTLRRHVRAGDIFAIQIGFGGVRPRLKFALVDLNAFIDLRRRAGPSRVPRRARRKAAREIERDRLRRQMAVLQCQIDEIGN